METIERYHEKLLGNYSNNKKTKDSYSKMYNMFIAMQRDEGTIKKHRHITIVPNYASRVGLWYEYQSLDYNDYLFFAWVKYKAGKSKYKTWNEIIKILNKKVPELVGNN